MLTRRIFQQRKKTYILKNNFRKINSFRDLPPPPGTTHHRQVMLQGLNIGTVRRQRGNYLHRKTSGGRGFGAGL